MHVDLQKSKQTAIIRFRSQVEQDFCVKALLDSKWNGPKEEKSAKQGKKSSAIKDMFNKKSKESVTPTRDQGLAAIDKVDTLSAEETQEYLWVIEEDKTKYQNYLKKVKQWKRKGNKTNRQGIE